MLIFLFQVVRQDEPLLITAINEMSLGKPSNSTKAFLRSLERPLSCQPKDKVALFPTNYMACLYNEETLFNFPGEEHEYVAVDSGEEKYLSKLAVDKVRSVGYLFQFRMPGLALCI